MPQLNTTSTADISFMLLIFFLVTTSMDVDKGLDRQLPPPDDEKEEVVTDISSDLALRIRLAADNHLLVNDEPVGIGEVRQRVVDFINGCEKPQEHVISIDISREADYDSYFALQNEIVAAYKVVRNRRAMRLYHQAFDACTDVQQADIRSYYPQRVAETY